MELNSTHSKRVRLTNSSLQMTSKLSTGIFEAVELVLWTIIRNTRGKLKVSSIELYTDNFVGNVTGTKDEYMKENFRIMYRIHYPVIFFHTFHL